MKLFVTTGGSSTTSKLIVLGVGLLIAGSLAAQDDSPPPQSPSVVGINNSPTATEAYNPNTSGDEMLTPPPVSGMRYPVALGWQEQSNSLHAELSFTSAYTDNALAGLTSHPISDMSYSVAPMITLDETTSRLHYTLTYAPGYTFYQRTSTLNAQDQNASIQFQYRLSPHVTLTAMDGFVKTSNILNQTADLNSGVVSGGVQPENLSVISPIANMLTNSGNVGLSYQYAQNDMMGAMGTFTNLHYLDQARVPGLFDSSSQGGLGFYCHRLGKAQYFGITYAYQHLLAFPGDVPAETQTHAPLAFYTLAPTSSRLSISLFGGAQYSDTIQPSIPSLHVLASETKMWTPAAGASLGWQTRLNSFALSCAHLISSSAGLLGASKTNSVMLSGRQQLTKTLSASVSGAYGQNEVVGNPMFGAYNGHTVSGTAGLQQQLGQHLGFQFRYTRLHQNYGNIAAISANPDTNLESIGITYQFARPLGR